MPRARSRIDEQLEAAARAQAPVATVEPEPFVTPSPLSPQEWPWWTQPYSEGRSITGRLPVSSPAAGANATVVIPAIQAWRLRGANARLVTDANAATRLVTVDYLDTSGLLVLSNGGSFGQAASLTNDYRWQSGRGTAEWNTGTPAFSPLEPTLLPPGFQVRFTVASIQATDQLSALSLYFDMFVTP